MNLEGLINLLKQIPASSVDFALYPTNKETLFFSLSSGAIPAGRSWKPAIDVVAGEGLARFKITCK